MIRKLKSGEYRLYSRKADPKTGKRRNLGTFSVDYEINAYTDAPDRMLPLYSALHANILDVFNEYGVQIMTPAYEGDPEKPKVVAREEWFTAPAAQPVRTNGDGASPPAQVTR